MAGKIIVVTHKDYQMPNDEVYLPVCVGTGILSLKDKFQPDNTGENISDKNSTYCELTAIYWAWKNLNLSELDYVGVAHYRRHFSMKKNAKSLTDVLSENELKTLKEKYGNQVVFTTPERRYVESIENHYIHSLKGYEEIHSKDIKRLRSAIHKCSPSYDEFALKVLRGKSAHMLNMFIMSADNFKTYCEWLFPVIDTVVAMSRDREDQRRYAGALSEFCLDIWAMANHIEIKELPLLETEKNSFVRKLVNYIRRKL